MAFLNHYESASSHSTFQFQQESIKLVDAVVPHTSSVFFLLDREMRHNSIVLNGIDPAVEISYQSHYNTMDPSSPELYQDTDVNVVCLADAMPQEELRQTIYYQEFLRPMAVEHVVNMFLRHEGRILVVFVMLRGRPLPKFSARDLENLRALQPFLEYAFNKIHFPKLQSQRMKVSKCYKLTDREIDVFEWIIAGAENKVIANKLGVGLATVKTHVHNIYCKIGVSSRTRLLSKIIAGYELSTSEFWHNPQVMTLADTKQRSLGLPSI